VVDLVVLASVLRATTKKRSSTFCLPPIFLLEPPLLGENRRIFSLKQKSGGESSDEDDKRQAEREVTNSVADTIVLANLRNISYTHGFGVAAEILLAVVKHRLQMQYYRAVQNTAIFHYTQNHT